MRQSLVLELRFDIVLDLDLVLVFEPGCKRFSH